MRRIVWLVCMYLAGGNALVAAVIAQWNFNSPTSDDEVATGSTSPSVGNGFACLVGGVSETFVTGDTKQDPAGTVDNSAWRTTKYPAADAANKTDGVRFDVDTTGYDTIALSWCQQNSATASRCLRLQYSLDGVNFVDADVIAISLDGAFTNQTVSLAAVAGVANNPAFAFRLVTEWESTALGSGLDGYVATKPTSNYGPGGAIRFDLVTISGRLIPGANTPPTINAIGDRILRVNASSEPISIWLNDAEDPADSLTLSARSSDPIVMPDANLILSGSGSVRALTLLTGTQAGTAEITLVATDPGGRWTSIQFQVTVLEANTIPTITAIPRANTLANSPSAPVEFAIGDGETASDSLTLTGYSLNTMLVSPGGILFGGSGSNRTISVIPNAGHTGVAPICVTVSDGTNCASTVFPVMVISSENVIFCESFDYSDGSIRTNSGFLWGNRSGKEGECEVVNRCLKLSSTQSEDIVASLIGNPYARTSNVALYASFSLQCTVLPKELPGLFAHFSDGSILRGRLYAGTANAGPGCFRLLVGNGAGPPTEMATDLSTNTIYRVVLRYDVAAASTIAWLDPSAESDPSTTASDSQAASPIVSFGFRQDSDLGGIFFVDDLLVGLSFASVMGSGNTAPIISAIGDQILRPLSSSGPLAFTIGDAQDLAGQLTLSCTSSSPDIIPPANISLEGTGSDRMVTVTASGKSGSAVVTVCVTDCGGLSSCTGFSVMVLADNTPPYISTIPCTNITVDTTSPLLSFTVHDEETASGELTVSAVSLNPSLVPDENVMLAGTEDERSVCVRPVPGKTGVAPIDLTVSDGTNDVHSLFAVMVTPSERVLFIDHFDYANGLSLTEFSGFWKTRSGPVGECQVQEGRLQIRANQREDVTAPLMGAPFMEDDERVLFASFRFSFVTLPKAEPGLFAHFANGNTLRGRIYAGTTNAAPGCFRLQVANGTTAVTELPLDLSLNTVYTAVTRYVLASATTTLWLDPTAESDSSISASDPQTPTPISAYGFREDVDVGANWWADDLVVGLSFGDVVSTPAFPRIPLSLQAGGDQLWLSWTNSAFALQSAVGVAGPYEDIPEAASPYTNRFLGQARFFRLKLK